MKQSYFSHLSSQMTIFDWTELRSKYGDDWYWFSKKEKIELIEVYLNKKKN